MLVKNMKRLLYIRNYPKQPNVNLYNLQEIGFCKSMILKGYNCDIVYFSKDEIMKKQCIFEHEGRSINIYWMKGFKFLNNIIYPKILNKDFLNKYDVIISTEYFQIMTYILCGKVKEKVAIYHGPYRDFAGRKSKLQLIYDKLFLKSIVNNCKCVFVKSKLAAKYLKNKGFRNPIVLGVGLDYSKFELESLADLPSDVRDLVIEMKKHKFILYIGRIDENKNTLFLLQVFNEIAKQVDQVRLLIVGNGEKEYKDKCFKYIEVNNLSEKVEYFSSIEQKYLKFIYENTFLTMLPSISEIFGMVMLESMYFGTPIATSVNGGSVTIIENGDNGLVFDNFNVQDWSRKILKLINNEKRRNNMGFLAKDKIVNYYTWDKIAEKFIKNYY